MVPQEKLDFERIAKIIDYLAHHFQEQPTLEQLAAHVNLSPSYFQRLFTNWAGTSPKKFAQYLSLTYAKQLLLEDRASLLQTSLKTGFSGPSRLHDLFLKIEGMTPGEYKNGGAGLSIAYSFAPTPFGQVIIASTPKGITTIAFVQQELEGVALLHAKFPHATFTKRKEPSHLQAISFFTRDPHDLSKIKLHLNGTPFQLKVWEALLLIPPGRLSTYGGIATRIQRPTACRAVGTAIGENPVAFLIPCHRVIQSTGLIGNYHWGASLKRAMIGWEGVQMHPNLLLDDEKNSET